VHEVRVTIHARDGSHRSHLLEPGDRVVLGRGASGVDLKLTDRLISRRHVQLELTGEGLLVTDLGSRNGTFLGGRRLDVGRPEVLRRGQVARIGEHTLTVASPAEETVLDLVGPALPRDEFEILGEIGSGAFGIVWAARQRLLGRMVAIKGLRPELELEESERAGILREGQLYCAIQSPYVVRLFDLRLVEGRVYLILEYADGASVADRLERGPLPIPEALKVAEDIARGLVAIAEAGVVHRDVKPQNVLLCLEGNAKLTDLGIARLVEASSASGDAGIGTIPYVAPEQADRGMGDLGPRTDLYGLGATLFHMLTGRPPFPRRGDPIHVLRKVLSEPPPPPTSLRVECPPAVEELVLALLEKDPDDRPESAALVAARLEELRGDLFPAYVPATPTSEEELDPLPPT
jgi:serine/threonine protein kinase